MSDKDKNTTSPDGKSPSEVSEPQKDIGETTRSKAQEILSAGPNTPPPNEPEAKKPPTREQLIYGLGLRSQWEIRSDHMVSLIEQDVFGLGKPFPSLDATLNSFTTEQLELASTLQEPTLLLVPETSFAAKMKALDAAKTMFMDEEDESKRQRDCYVDDIYRKTDSGSNIITGWKAVIVEGGTEMKRELCDERELDDSEDLEIWELVRDHKAVRRPGESGFDRHLYAMLMLEALKKGKPIDGGNYTVLDDDPALTATHVPSAYWSYDDRRVSFFGDDARVVGGTRVRSSVGGEVKF